MRQVWLYGLIPAVLLRNGHDTGPSLSKIIFVLMNIRKTTLLLLCLGSINIVFSQTPKKTTPKPPPAKTTLSKDDQFIENLLAKMTLEEKIGQLNLLTTDWDVTGPTIRLNYKEDIAKGRVGNMFNAHTAKFTRELQRIAVEETRLKIPLLFGYDVIHGYKTIFPVPLGEAASWDTTYMRRTAAAAADEAASAGLHWTFAPMVDIARDPRWGRIMEGAGEDTYLGSAIAKARVEGFQGSSYKQANSVVACAKHYAVYGAAQAGRDYSTVDISERTLWETYLPPFKAALDAGVGTFMTSFNEVDGVPASGNKHLLTDILKKRWGFRGFVVTDYTSINEMIQHGVAANGKEAAELAINAGVDMDMQGETFVLNLAQLVKEKKVSEATINEAVRRILKTKQALGLFQDPYKFSNEDREKNTLMKKEYKDLSLEMAKRSIVLLKNEQQVLPIAKTVGKIALIGPLADDTRNLIGAWSGAGDHTYCVTLRQGIESYIGPDRVLYAKGCGITNTDTFGFDEAKKIAEEAQVIVMAVGEESGMSGEAASRSDIGLPGAQRRLIEEIVSLGRPVVLVLMNGRPLTLQWENDHVASILETWFLGTRAGDAIAQVLFGDYNPSGKLPITFPRSVGQIPIFYNMKNSGRPFMAEEKYTSKYLDIPNTPLYPFGYGLSYTTFEYFNLRSDKTKYKQGETIKVSIDLTNAGSYDGEEVVQLYIHDLVGSTTRPVRELKGFQKVMLKKGENRTITFNLKTSDLAFYTRDMSFKAEPGDFEIYVGGNSNTGNKVKITLEN